MCAHCTLLTGHGMQREGELCSPRSSCSMGPRSAPPGVSKDRYASCLPEMTHSPVIVMLIKALPVPCAIQWPQKVLDSRADSCCCNAGG